MAFSELDATRLGVSPDRAAKDMVVEPGPGIGGFTEYGARGKVVRLSVPLGQLAMSRCIRYHELLHARYSKPNRLKGFHPLCLQAVEDSIIHTRCWPIDTDRQTKRDTLAFAIRELRELVKKDGFATNWNCAVLTLFRGNAIVRKLADNLRSKTWRRLRAMTIDYVPKVVANTMLDAQNQVDYCPMSRVRKVVAKILNPLFIAQEFTQEFTTGGPKPLPNVNVGDTSRMEVVTLPHSERCNDMEDVNYSRTSGLLRGCKIVNAVTTGNMSQLFRKRKALDPTGTVLIDASGSMQVTRERLLALCRACPGAQVAYYSGRSRGIGGLCIFAKDGFRFSGTEIPYFGDMNAVDGPALRWLLSQDGPRVIITDGAFCGGPDCEQAKTALDVHLHRGDIRQITSLTRAMEEFTR